MAEISVNIFDLSKDPIVAQFLIAPVVRGRLTKTIDKDRPDETAIILECDRERALAIVEVIRTKYGRNELRCYDGKRRI